MVNAEIIINWIKDFVEKSGRKRIVLGVSGGVDSSTALVLACKAIGPENIVPIHIFVEYDSVPEPLLKLCENLGIRRCLQFPISQEVSSLESSFLFYPDAELEDVSNALPGDKMQLVLGNLMARLRMAVQFIYSNSLDGLTMGMMNKSKYMLGYGTLFGDFGGCDFEPIQHLYKYEVYELARQFPEIPQEIIDAEPGTGLWPLQTDVGELGHTYDEIDAMLQGLIPMAEDIKNRIASTEHKRNPIPHM